MLLIDTEFADDDLRVLSAYAQAQDAAEAARKSQQQAAADAASVTGDDSDEFEPAWEDGAAEGGGVTTLESKTAARRVCTWVSRLREVDGVPQDHLVPVHGRLIAHGLLQFQLQGREDGVVYRVTAAGRQMLNPPSAEAA